MTPARTVRSVVALLALAGSSWAVCPASAQNALGDGTALDANPGNQGRINRPRPSFSQELQFRNAIVTGNAPGGLSFRGDLGYRAPGEFTGDLGSDALYSFRRDSLTSGLAGMGIRGTDALQYQFSLSTGAQPPRNLMGDMAFTRDSQYQSSASYSGIPSATGQTGLQRDPNDIDPRGLDLYQPSPQEYELADALMGAMRSASTYTTTSNLSPTILSVFEQGVGFDRQRFGLTASSLTGVTAVPMQQQPGARPGAPQPGTQGGTRPGVRPGVQERPGQTDAGARDPTRVRTAYDEIVERVRERAAMQAERSVRPESEQAEEARSVLERLEEIRRGMTGEGQPPRDPAAPDARRDAGQPDAGAGSTVNPNDPRSPTRPGMSDPGTNLPGADAPSIVAPGATPETGTGDPAGGAAAQRFRDEYGRERFVLDAETLDMIRAMETPLPTFVDPDADSRDLYSEHMRAGERLIAAERYFDAEERFARALSVRPGDPTAQIGRAHAQLGAGLLLSASVNLRSLFFLNPEVLGARYAGRLLPSPERIDRLIETLEERSGVVRVPGRGLEDDSTRVAAGFVLAYLGYQNDRPEIIRAGLDVMQEVGSEEDTRAADIFEQIWLHDRDPEAVLPADAEGQPGTDAGEDR